jgi:RNA polymerase sigma factor (sigma-70 family)
MAEAGVGRVVRLIQTLWDGGTVASLDDAELLRRFLGHDATAETAFAALVRRHAPMVLRVCRDVTGDSHDAQDAAQVTFLVLARRADSIRRGEALANWLFGTARRVSARLVRDSARGRRHERRYAETATIRRDSDDATGGRGGEWAELYAELDRLPERYRVPIVLCDLEGLTHDQAAAVLGCPIRTLQARLYRGRERLRRRLLRRGLSPAVGLVSGSLSAEAGPAVSASWADATIGAAMGMAKGRAGATVVPEAANLLFQGVTKAMFLTRLLRIAAVIVVLGLPAGLTFGLAPIAPRLQVAKTGPGTKSVAEEAKPAPPAPITTPITVRGRATDRMGRPIVGATIFLVSTNGKDAVLGTTTTDRDGAYTFRNARLPVSRSRDDAPLAGTFQVYGTALGFGFAWHGMRFYYPQRRPDDWKVAGEDYNLFGPDPKVMDLRFPPAAILSGRILDETGRPVVDARIRMSGCDHLDTEGKESHANFREFRAIDTAPAALTTTKTDPDGRFRLDGLPGEAGVLLIIEHPDYAWTVQYAATTDRPATAIDYPPRSFPGLERLPVATGEVRITLRGTRPVAVRTVFAHSGRPAPRVRVHAGLARGETQANGITDADGKMSFRLPPGEYEILADPTVGGADVIRTISKFTVTDKPSEQSLEVRVNPGCVLFLDVVDAKTGKGIPGVEFLCEPADRPRSRVRLQSRTGYIDNPRSDSNGRLRAVVEPGDWIYTVGHIPESTGHRRQYPQKRVALRAGGTATVRFELAP